MTEFLRKISKSDIRNILAVVTVIGCFVLMYLLIITPIPAMNKDIVLTALGFVFGGLLGGVSGFYFGASKTDNKKDEEV